MKPLYTVSIACHNLLALTKRCVDSVLASDDLERLEIIVTDNCSTDQTYEYVEGLSKKAPISLSRKDRNLGFGRAHNEALQFAKGTYFVVLNNDATVPTNWLNKMRRCFLDDPKVGIAGVNGTCKHLNPLGVGGGGEGEPDYAEGSCLMVPTWLARKVGLFYTANYRFAYCEDADLSLRLRLLGYAIAHADVSVRHQAGSTAQLVASQGVDLVGFHAINHTAFQVRWGPYLRTRKLGETVVIQRTGAWGDLLMLTPALRQLKAQNHHNEIWVSTDVPEVFRDNPDVYRAAKDTYFGGKGAAAVLGDRCLDLAYERRPHLHPTDAFAHVLGLRKGSVDKRPRVYPNKEAREWAKTMMPGRNWCVVHPHIGQEWPGRNWSVDNFGLAVHRLKRGQQACCPGTFLRSSWRFALVGTDGTPGIPGDVDLDLRGKTTFHQLAAAIERADLFLGVDSLPMHLARAAQIPIVAVFGSIDPKLRLTDVPFEAGVTADPMSVGCLGCHHVYEPPRTTGQCIRDREYCMERLTVEKVLEAIPRVLEAKKMMLETSKIRERVLPYLQGKGIDIGCGRDPITTDCLTLDRDPWPEVTHVGDARKLPFGDAEFDFLWSSHCLEDLADTEAALAEWIRVVRRGGVIGLYVPHPELYAKTGMVNLDHLHPGFTPDDLSDLLKALGCEILTAEVDDAPPQRYSTLVLARKSQ